MKKVVMIKFAVPVARVLKHFQDLSFYRSEDPMLTYLNVWYDGTDFIVENTALNEGQKNPRKVYVAKTNVAQWELDDTEGKGTSEGVSEKKPSKAKP